MMTEKYNHKKIICFSLEQITNIEKAAKALNWPNISCFIRYAAAEKAESIINNSSPELDKKLLQFLRNIKVIE
jgi:uncharacterized protein (DUF1778 family)